MNASLKLKRRGGVTGDGNYFLSLEVTESEILPKEVFIHRVDDRGREWDEYISIASVADLETLRTDRSKVGKYQVYRSNKAYIVFSSLTAANRGSEEIPASLKDLIDAYSDALRVLELDDVIEVL